MSRFVDLFQSLPIARRLAVAVLAIVSVVVIVILSRPMSGASGSVLLSGLEPGGAGEVGHVLDARGIRWDLDSSGGALRVAEADLPGARLALAEEGLPRPTSGTAGFELFDQSSFGVSTFVQRTNYLRAMQGELARTISSLAEVEWARVHLVIPERTLFWENATPASASVMLHLRRGSTLSDRALGGIVHLVASSVEGLGSEAVTVVDEHGSLLAGGDTATGMGGRLDLRARYERETEARIESMLSRVVGPGMAVVRVSADFDFASLQRVQESYDPDRRAVRKESKSSSSGSATTPQNAMPSGIPGSRTKLGGATASIAVTNSSGSANVGRTEVASTEFELTKTTDTTVDPRGTLRRQSIAVLLGGIATLDSAGIASVRPPAESELETLRGVVRDAAGHDDSRGDRVTVATVPFVDMGVMGPGGGSKGDEPRAGGGADPDMKLPLATAVGAAAGALILGGLLASLLRRRPVPEPPAKQVVLAALPAATSEGSPAPDPIRKFASDDPERAMHAIRTWLRP